MLLPGTAGSQVDDDPRGRTVDLLVVDALTGNPIPNVRVRSRAPELDHRTDPAGHVSVTAPEGEALFLEFEKAGYEGAVGLLQVGDASEVLVGLTPASRGESPGASVITGWVTDGASDDPLEGVRIAIPDAGLSALSGADGGFTFRGLGARRGLRVVFSRLGYADREIALDLEDGRRVELQVDLAGEAIELDPVEVTVEPRSRRLEIAGFYDRRRLGQGQFLGIAQIERRTVSRTTDLFNDFRGIRFMDHYGDGREEAIAFQRGQVVKSVIDGRRVCYPAVWIDDVKVAGGGSEPAVLNRYVNPREVAGIEIYTGAAQIPSRYSGTGSACGVILVWTRG